MRGNQFQQSRMEESAMRAKAWVLMLGIMLGCGGDKGAPVPAPPADAGAGGLTAFQTEHGIGPITAPVEVGATPDHEMAEEGKEVFQQKCGACHKMGEKYVGPALGEVTKRRTPAYIMNMILNPQEMVERHPVAKQLLAEHMTFMPNQGLTKDEAREVVEYLRTQAK
jgi:mono/diheme cytochrome c family protein